MIIKKEDFESLICLSVVATEDIGFDFNPFGPNYLVPKGTTGVIQDILEDQHNPSDPSIGILWDAPSDVSHPYHRRGKKFYRTSSSKVEKISV